MRHLRLVVASVLVAIGLLAQGGTPVITEFLASNDQGLLDQDGDSSDWIEIHNPTAGFVDLGGSYLTDSPGSLTRWTIPSPTFLLPSGFIVIFASDKDRAVAGQELHTNFKLSAGGEYLALVAPDGMTILSEFSPQYPPQTTDVSYGLSFNPGLTANEAWFVIPTPGSANGVGGSLITAINHSPPLPQDQDDIVVTAAIADPPGASTATATLHYRVGFAPEIIVAMVDDGTGADLAAGDGIWTALIPSSWSYPQDMVRWRVTSTISGGLVGAWSPLYPDPLNSPRYRGTVIQDSALSSQIGILHWFVQNPAAAQTQSGTRCSVYYLGHFYDNVFVRIRGGSSLGWIKPNFKFDFNTGDHFLFDPAEDPVEEFNLNSTWSDKAYFRRILAWETYQGAGAPGSLAFPMRVQRNKQFYSLGIFVEQPDERMLDRLELDRQGALYKMYNQLTSATSGVEKKTRLGENNADLQALVSGIQLSGPALESYLFDNIDLPAVVSYLAATVLMNDNDHVHKNYYLYRDSEGDGEWLFLPWDKDLTFGRNYTLTGGVLNDSMWSSTDPQCHPLFGDANHPKVDGPWNRLIDACYRTPRIRSMVMRRLRSTMDDLLQPPGTPSTNLAYENRIQALTALTAPEVALDQTAWGVPSWGSPSLTFSAAINQLKSSYLAPRRLHLYQTHGPPTGIIPGSQGPVALGFGTIEASPVSGNPAEGFIEIVNCNAFAVDVSGWQLTGGVDFDFPPGTVIAAQDSLHVAADVVAFRNRSSSPSGGQGLFVLGPYQGSLAPTAPLELRDAAGLLVSGTGTVAYSLGTSGNGDLALQVLSAAAGAELRILFSLDTSGAVGCGPIAGLGVDAFWLLLQPLGAAPFHVLADPAGAYSFTLPPGSIPPGLGVDSRVIAFDATSGAFDTSPVRRVWF
jgi:hypothetical protein